MVISRQYHVVLATIALFIVLSLPSAAKDATTAPPAGSITPPFSEAKVECSKAAAYFIGPCLTHKNCQQACLDQNCADGRCNHLFGKCKCCYPCWE